MDYLTEWSSSCFALCTMSTAALSPLSSEPFCCISPQTYSLISHCCVSFYGYFGHTTQNQRGKMSKACWHHQRCSEKTSGPFQKAAVTAFQSACDVLFAESTKVGSQDVDTTVKMTPRRLALHSFMMKSCATIHPHMRSSNI